MEEKIKQTQEKILKAKSGWGMLILSLILVVAGVVVCALSSQVKSELLLIVPGVIVILVGALLLLGLKTVNPNEAIVLTLFGKYYGTLKQDGFFWVNPFSTAFNPAAGSMVGLGRKLSLKAMTLNNEKQKVNDEEGNPIEIGFGQPVVAVYPEQRFDLPCGKTALFQYLDGIEVCPFVVGALNGTHPVFLNQPTAEIDPSQHQGSPLSPDRQISVGATDQFAPIDTRIVDIIA